MKKFIIILIVFLLPVISNGTTFKGIILDKNNNPIIGATIRIEGSSIGTRSKNDGTFEITNLPNKYKTIYLLVTYIGYKNYKEKISIDTNYLFKKIILEEELLKTDEIVITANKRVQAVQDVPISISVINKNDIIDRGTVELDQILNYVSGLEVNQDNISIRGTSGFTFGIGSRTAVLVDGFPLLAGDNNDIKFDAIPMLNVERIEIVKGAGSALYGTSTVGGIINIITKKAEEFANVNINTFLGYYTKPRFEQWIWNENGSFYSGLNLSYSQKLNNFSLILSGQYINDESYRYYDDAIRTSLFSKINYEANNKLNLGLTFNISKSDATDWVYWNSLDSATKPPTNTNTEIRIKSDKISLYGDLNYIINSNNFIIFRTGAFFTEYYNTYDSNLDEYRQSNAININNELQLNSRLFDNVILTYGLNINNILVRSKTYGDENQNIYSAYLQTEYSGINKLIATIGTRLDYEDVKFADNNIEISPKFGLNYNLSKYLNLRASIGRGFRAPSIAERYSSVAFQGFDVLPNKNLKPEISWSYEIGFNYEFSIYKIPFYIDFAIFKNDLSNLIEPTFVGNNEPKIQFQNIKEARIEGIEFNFRTLLFNYIGIQSAVTLMDPKDLTLNQTLNYRSELLSHNSIIAPITNFISIQIDYRYKKKFKNIDKQLGLIVKDIDSFVDMNVIDLRIISKLNDLLNINGKLIFSVNNLFDYYYTVMVGNLAPTRKLLFQLQLDF
jgi:iron complex outermembrane receptor protein